eukprot:XP_001691770.1 predicted protein [Chlamydomonas reinhardtii]
MLLTAIIPAVIALVGVARIKLRMWRHYHTHGNLQRALTAERANAAGREAAVAKAMAELSAEEQAAAQQQQQQQGGGARGLVRAGAAAGGVRRSQDGDAGGSEQPLAAEGVVVQPQSQPQSHKLHGGGWGGSGSASSTASGRGVKSAPKLESTGSLRERRGL